MNQPLSERTLAQHKSEKISGLLPHSQRIGESEGSRADFTAIIKSIKEESNKSLQSTGDNAVL